MIERFYLRDYLTFQEASLELNRNLIIFTGPSGAGKSIFMDALLTLFGLKDCEASHIEATIDKHINFQKWAIKEDSPNIFRFTKQKSARYFINNQQVSKKSMKEIGKTFVNYLTLREFNDFENDKLLNILDNISIKTNPTYKEVLENFSKTYKNYKTKSQELEEIYKKEKNISDLKEFAKFEIEKIEEISPQEDEYENLLLQKKELSKKEKIEEAISKASTLFEMEPKVIEALSLLDIDSTFIDDSFNELRAIFENAKNRLEELDDLNIEQMLQRLEDLSSLKKRHGSIQNALNYLQQKKDELKKYENIEFEKEQLTKDVEQLKKEVNTLALNMTQERKKALKVLTKKVEYYLNLLQLEKVSFDIKKRDLHNLGCDEVNLSLKTTDLKKISSGELNRLRLAYLGATSEFTQTNGGILILDEIDANLSGKESMSVAKVLKQLSKTYQIFAISHQPQLTSTAEQHFLIYKENNKSFIKELTKEQRVHELSRMISGDDITKEAIDFANKLLN